MPYVTRTSGTVDGWSKWNTTGGGQEFLSLPDAEITTFNAIGDTLPVAKAINLLSNYIDGFQLSNDTDTAHDILVGVGTARDNADAVMIKLATAIAKQIDVNWAAGDDAGGFPSGLTLTADTWYHVFAIHNTALGTIDAGFDTSLTATNLLSDATGYSAFRLVGSVLTDSSSNILNFIQSGEYFYWKDPILDHNASVGNGVDAAITISTPAARNVIAMLNILDTGSGAGDGFSMRPPSVNSEAPSLTAGPLYTLLSTTAADTAHGIVNVLAESSIVDINTIGTTIRRIVTLGWIDRRGRDNT